MRHEKTIPARELCIGDELSWDRVERFFWLTVQKVTIIINDADERELLVIIDLELPFDALSGLGSFYIVEDSIFVYAIDVDSHRLILRQQNKPEDALLIRQHQAGEI